jgi:hypothetical protein
LSEVVAAMLIATTFRPYLVQKQFLFLFSFWFFDEQLLFHSFPNMASSSSENNFDLNVVIDAQSEILHPSFLSQKGHLSTNDSTMLDDAIVTSVAKCIITPRDEKLLVEKTDAEAINDSMAFSIQGTTTISMG